MGEAAHLQPAQRNTGRHVKIYNSSKPVKSPPDPIRDFTPFTYGVAHVTAQAGPIADVIWGSADI